MIYQNGGTTCPSCRGLSTSVIPSRALQSMVNVLLRADPSRIRTPSERSQADEIYRPGQSLRVCDRSPPGINFSPNGCVDPPTKGALARTHSAPEYRFCTPLSPLHPWKSLWMEVRCVHTSLEHFLLTFVSVVQIPSWIRKPTKIKGGCWRMVHLPAMGSVDTGKVPCGFRFRLPRSSNDSENLVALLAPSTSCCDFCQVSFCGIGIPERCYATSLHSQHLNGFSDLGDLIQAADIYECFEGNTVEVEMLFDYLTQHLIAPKHIYQEVPVPPEFYPRPSNRFPRSSIKFRTPPNNSHHCSTKTSSLRFTGSPGVLIPIQPPLVRRYAGGVPPRFFCGVSAIGGSRRGGRAAFQLPSLKSRTAPTGNLVGIRRIRVRLLNSLWVWHNAYLDADHARECMFSLLAPWIISY